MNGEWTVEEWALGEWGVGRTIVSCEKKSRTEAKCGNDVGLIGIDW